MLSVCINSYTEILRRANIVGITVDSISRSRLVMSSIASKSATNERNAIKGRGKREGRQL